MAGMDRISGKHLSGIDHVRQSVVDILTTPIGSRVLRREYGSRLFELIDAPSNNATLVDIYSAVAQALARWEPRLQLERVALNGITPGVVSLDVSAQYIAANGDRSLLTLDNLRLESI